jgi:hypothetical protein
MTFNGWKNRETWNVALWLENTEESYKAIVEFMKDYHGTAPYKDFLLESGLSVQSTGDGTKYFDEKLDYVALNEMMLEHRPEGHKPTRR